MQVRKSQELPINVFIISMTIMTNFSYTVWIIHQHFCYIRPTKNVNKKNCVYCTGNGNRIFFSRSSSIWSHDRQTIGSRDHVISSCNPPTCPVCDNCDSLINLSGACVIVD